MTEPRSGSARSRGGFDRTRTIYRDRDREYSLRASEVRTLTDLGKFRVVPADDLARFGYQGNRSQMESDVRSLSRQGLVEQRTIEGHSSYSAKILTLTKEGHRLLVRGQVVSSRQATYHGFVKPKEARHDADLYRLYQRVAKEIERTGGKVQLGHSHMATTLDIYTHASGSAQRDAVNLLEEQLFPNVPKLESCGIIAETESQLVQ